MTKVLLVEDSKTLQLAITRCLTKAGYEVASAEDGEKGLALARSGNPDIILLDMMLPKLSGPEVLGQLKMSRATTHIPVIVLTGLSQKNEQRLRSDGAIAFFGKNQWAEDPKSLLSMIENVLHPITDDDLESQLPPPNVNSHLLPPDPPVR